MIPLPWLLIAGLLLSAAAGWGGFQLGQDVANGAWVEKELTRVQKVLVRVEKERVIETRVEIKYINGVTTIFTRHEEVKNEIPTIVSDACVLPSDFMRDLRAVSRNATVAALGIPDEPGEGASCRAVLEVLAKSYANHYADAEQLNAWIARETALTTQ